MKLLILPLLFIAFTAQAQSLQVAKGAPPASILRGIPATYQPANLSSYQLSPAQATACYGFFCRQELKMDKHTAMPVRFRLGSMEQCNRLEGKNP